MSLIKTEEYLYHTLITTMPQSFESNIYNIVFTPPKNNIKIIKISIYDYDIYHPLYEIYLAQEPIYITNLFFQSNKTYKISADGDVQMYYEKKEDIKP